MIYVAVIETSEDTILFSSESGTVNAFKTEEEGLKLFEDAYDAKHKQSYEASMSAVINFIQFNPTILGFKDVEELEAALLPNLKTNGAKVLKLRSISGSITGVQLEVTDELRALLEREELNLSSLAKYNAGMAELVDAHG